MPTIRGCAPAGGYNDGSDHAEASNCDTHNTGGHNGSGYAAHPAAGYSDNHCPPETQPDVNHDTKPPTAGGLNRPILPTVHPSQSATDPADSSKPWILVRRRRSDSSAAAVLQYFTTKHWLQDLRRRSGCHQEVSA